MALKGCKSRTLTAWRLEAYKMPKLSEKPPKSGMLFHCSDHQCCGCTLKKEEITVRGTSPVMDMAAYQLGDKAIEKFWFFW